jgi:4-amino-4-deoxy-L-arabinose transferase-like glycosyltransferase
MSVILVFVCFVIVGDGVAMGIAAFFERFSEHASLLVFLALFILVFWVSWKAAVHVTERYILRQH